MKFQSHVDFYVPLRPLLFTFINDKDKGITLSRFADDNSLSGAVETPEQQSGQA